MFATPDTFLYKTMGAIDMPPGVFGYETIRVKPDAAQWARGSMNASWLNGGNASAATQGNAFVHTVRGDASVSATAARVLFP